MVGRFAGVVCAVLMAGVGAAQGLANPILEHADPFITAHPVDGRYLLLATTGRNITIWSGKTVPAAAGEAKVLFTPPDGLEQIWSPTIWEMEGRWWIYFTARMPGGEHAIYVLESDGGDALGSYSFKGALNLGRPAIDPSVLTVKGVHYLMWVSVDRGENAIQMVRLAGPLEPAGASSVIAEPEFPWEKGAGSTRTYPVDEGPTALYHDGKTFVVFSGSDTASPLYCLGLLTYLGGDPLDRGSWKKTMRPVFSASPANGIYGPGRGTFAEAADGAWWLLYAAKSTDAPNADNRAIRAQRFTWNKDGTPNFGAPVKDGAAKTAEARLMEAYPASMKLYHDKKYAEAAALLEPFYAAGPEGVDWNWSSAMYDLACEEALAGRTEKAIEVLTASQSGGGSVKAEDMAKDTDLVSLHGDARFTKLVERARVRERLWSEPGQSLGYAQNLSEDEKVAGLSTVWAEARFNFAFFDRQPALDWNAAYVEYLAKVRATTSTEEYYRALMRFGALLKDGHTNVYPPEAIQNAFYARPGLRTRVADGSVVVTKVLDPALTAHGWRVGDVILTIDDEEVRRYAEREVAPYQSSSTAQDLEVRTYTYALLGGRAGSVVRVRARTVAGKEEERALTRLSVEEQGKLKRGPGASFAMRPDGIAVLTVDEFEDTEGTKVLLANLPQVRAAKGLVIDVRANGGGSTPVDLLQVLAKGPVHGALVQTRSYVAGYRAKGVLPGWTNIPPFEAPADVEHHVDVPVAVLTSGQTFSAAEDFVAAFDAMHRGITVGEPTAGSTGQPLFFALPGGGSARVCTRNDRAPDGTVFEGVGLMPTIAVSPTLESVQKGSDTAMERAAGALLAAR